METQKFVCYECLEELFCLDSAITHLKSHYGTDNTDLLLSCVKAQTKSDLFCTAGFRSFKSLKSHLKGNKCVLMCKDISNDDTEDTQELGNDSNLLSFGGSAETDRIYSPIPTYSSQNVASDPLEKNREECQKFEVFQQFIEQFVERLITFNLCHNIVDEILRFSKELVCKVNKINECMLKENPNDTQLVLTSTSDFVSSHIDTFSTRFKRDLHFKKNQYYVAPQTIYVDPANIRATFQHVSVYKTLTTLFKNDRFMQEYLEYNNNHTCVYGVYERFCCGKKFKENAVFLSEKNVIQLQIYFDDFELCSPLKTKSRKISALYFTIHNFSPKFTSQSNNMYLISLCDAKVVKEYGLNAILKHVVNDVKYLETQGILVGGNVRLKGTIVQISFDNLGGNAIFGMAKCFNCTHFCRICNCPKERTQKICRELEETLRTRDEYDKIMEKLAVYSLNKKKIDLKETLGFQNYSILNDLNYFHTINNRSQDRMHDIDEGAMPFVLGHLFDYLSSEDIITLNEIKEKVKSFNYGILERQNVPSDIFFKKSNLNQNASQMRCLTKHLPFIFKDLLKLQDYEKRRKVHKVWKIVEFMLKINQIADSNVITELDIINLENYVAEFLKCIQTLFGVHLIPKLHFLTHYAETIRQMGSIKKLQTIRGEAKHQTFTRYGKRTNNFMNICKTLAHKHQQQIVCNLRENTYSDRKTTSKKNRVLVKYPFLIKNFDEYAQLFSNFFGNLNDVMITDYLVMNSFYFKKGLFVLFSNQFCQIEAILFRDQTFVFFCSPYRTVRFQEFSNSIQITKSTDRCILLIFSDIESKKSYEGKISNGKTYIIVDELDLQQT